jgi:hypothetical protein
MNHFKILQKHRTYVPSYKKDFIRSGFYAFLVSVVLETYLIFGKKYEKIYKSTFIKQLELVRDIDRRTEEKILKSKLIQQKMDEVKMLESKLQKLNEKPIR